MKQFILALYVFLLTHNLSAQWTTSGSNIYNSNSGSVGIGTTTPSQQLEVNGSILATRLIAYGSGGISSNTAIGAGTLSSNTSGIFNTGIGLECLQYNTTGFGNVAAGTLALGANSTGNYNTAFGPQSLNSNISGTNNAATGYQALYYNTGIGNTANGYQSLYNNSSGSNNVGIGQSAGSSITSGSSNICIGNGAQVPSATASNQLSIGNWIYGVNGSIGIGTTSINANYKLFVETGIRTRLVVVDNSTWPDYVFQSGYHLPPLTSIEQYIDANHHLPGIPTADSVLKNGLDLGESEGRLLKKIEELTLYTIELQKKIEKLELANKELEITHQLLERLQKQIDEVKSYQENSRGNQLKIRK